MTVVRAPAVRTAPGAALLRSLLRGGLAYLGLFLAVHTVLALGPTRAPVLEILLLVLVGVPQAVLVLRRRLELGTRSTATLCVTLVAAAAIGIWTLPPGAGGSSYAAWFLGAIAFNLLGLTLVGRYAAAWITMAAIVLVAIVWTTATGQGTGFGIGLVVRHVATLLVGTALAAGLRRSTAAFAASRVLERARRAEEEAARESAAARRTAVERVLDQAGPMLRTIADGEPLTDEDRRRLLVLEGSLRDEIRTPGLLYAPLSASVAAARGRGVNVLLMDEAPGVAEEARQRAAAWLASRLDDVQEGAFVGRLRDLDGELRASAVGDASGDATTFDLG